MRAETSIHALLVSQPAQVIHQLARLRSNLRERSKFTEAQTSGPPSSWETQSSARKQTDLSHFQLKSGGGNTVATAGLFLIPVQMHTLRRGPPRPADHPTDPFPREAQEERAALAGFAAQGGINILASGVGGPDQARWGGVQPFIKQHNGCANKTTQFPSRLQFAHSLPSAP